MKRERDVHQEIAVTEAEKGASMKDTQRLTNGLMLAVCAMNVLWGHDGLRWAWGVALVCWASLVVYDWLEWRRRQR